MKSASCAFAWCGSGEGCLHLPPELRAHTHRITGLLGGAYDPESAESVRRYKAAFEGKFQVKGWELLNLKHYRLHHIHFKPDAFKSDGSLRSDALDHLRSKQEVAEAIATRKKKNTHQKARPLTERLVEGATDLDFAKVLAGAPVDRRKLAGPAAPAKVGRPRNDPADPPVEPSVLRPETAVASQGKKRARETSPTDIRKHLEAVHARNIVLEQELRSERQVSAARLDEVNQWRKLYEDLRVVADKLIAESLKKKSVLRVEDFAMNSKAILTFTSLQDHEAFMMLYQTYNGENEGRTKREGDDTFKGRKPDLDAPNRLFMTLMFLRLGLNYTTLGHLFGVSEDNAGRYIRTHLSLLATFVRECYPTPTRAEVDGNMPQHFKEVLGGRFVYLIVDGMEVRTETSSNPAVQRVMHSLYKSGATIKTIVGITPDGYIVVMSNGQGGRISDIEALRDSGIYEMLTEPYMNIMADKGFTGASLDLLLKHKAFMIAPQRKGKRAQFSGQEIKVNSLIAHLRIHVERAIKIIRDFHILSGTIPQDYWPIFDDITTVVRGLANLNTPMTCAPAA